MSAVVGSVPIFLRIGEAEELLGEIEIEVEELEELEGGATVRMHADVVGELPGLLREAADAIENPTRTADEAPGYSGPWPPSAL